MPFKQSAMTNRTGQGSASAGGRSFQKPMRFLDLSFEGREQARVNTLSNGFRPHGGYRDRIKGSSGKHPPAIHSFNKPADYQEQLQEDLDKLFHDDKMSRCSSPAWALDISHEGNHSGESPLFVHKLLSPSRVDQQFQSTAYRKSLNKSKRTKPPNQKNGTSYYRPNKTHQYLTKTELKNSTSTEVDVKLGKPTRTTLLRARQRCNSAPINGYDTRREQMKMLEKKDEFRRSRTPTLTIRDLLGESAPDGESLHSFLIGARYNRAHYLDAKSLVDHGVYMPRNNPLGCFVIKKSMTKSDFEADVPNAPPDSPASFLSDDEDNLYAPRPGTPTQPPSRPNKIHRQAWDDSTKVEVSIAPEETGPLADNHIGEERGKGAPHTIPIIQQIMNLDDGLNVKGKKFNNSRPRSARAHANQHLPYTSPRPSSAHPSLPAVAITGHSINRVTKTSIKDTSIDQTTLANNPPNTPHLLAPEPLDNCTSPQPPHTPVPSQEQEPREDNVVEGPEAVGEPRIDPAPSPEEQSPNIAVEKVDKGVNCPSVPSVAGDLAGSKPSQQADTKGDRDMKENQNEPELNEPREDEQNEAWPDDGKPELEKKVRFADEVGEGVQHKGDDVLFFITEDKQMSENAGGTNGHVAHSADTSDDHAGESGGGDVTPEPAAEQVESDDHAADVRLKDVAPPHGDADESTATDADPQSITDTEQKEGVDTASSENICVEAQAPDRQVDSGDDDFESASGDHVNVETATTSININLSESTEGD